MATRELSEKDVIGPLDTFFNQAEALRKQGLQEILTVQALKKRQLAQEKQRLSVKLGEDHPRVRQIAARLDRSERVEKGLVVLIDESGVRAPAAGETDWQVEGRVLDAKGKGVPGVTVSLFDKRRRWVRPLGYSCSDEFGFYAIKYTPKKGAEESELEAQELIVTVSGQDYKVLCQHPDPVTIRAGQTEVRNVTLSGQASICTPPQPETDDTVVPSDVWTIRGRVTDSDNKVVAGATVRLRDEQGRFTDKLPPTKTDDQGRFTLTYRGQDIREVVQADPDLFLEVSDAAGKPLYSSAERLKFRGGQAENRDVRTTAGPVVRRPPKEDKPDKGRKPTQPPRDRP